MENEIRMSEKESLELIASMINKAKNRAEETGTLYVFSVFISMEYQLLLIAAAVIVAWITPGFILKQNFKKEN